MSSKLNVQKCPVCGGYGYYETTTTIDCSKCAGTGRDTSSDLWLELCAYCHGSGKQKYKGRVKCSRCGGCGFLYN